MGHINLNEYKSIGTLRISFYVNADNVITFDSFRVEHILTGIKKFMHNTFITTFFLGTSIRFNNVWILLYWIF